MRIRHACEDDLETIVHIHNQAITSREYLGILTPFSTEERKPWFQEFSEDTYPLLVAEKNRIVIGWSCIKPYRPQREALDRTCEISFFIDEDHRRKGVGKALLKHMIATAAELNYKVLIAIIFHTNKASNQLLVKMNFKRWGEMPGVAEIDGMVLNHLYYGLRLSNEQNFG